MQKEMLSQKELEHLSSFAMNKKRRDSNPGGK
jgi:hypothetical protein